MSKKLWFKAKRYGYGWTPTSWEGWLILVVYIIFLIVDFRRIDANSHSNSDTLRPFFIDVILATLMLLFIAYIKGEKPGWRWGGKK